MRVRGIAFGLALLLATVKAAAATPMCCTVGRLGVTTIRSVDCCGTVLIRCPTSTQAVVSNASLEPAPGVRTPPLSVVSGRVRDSLLSPLRPAASGISLTLRLARPPLFRLYSQLLI